MGHILTVELNLTLKVNVNSPINNKDLNQGLWSKFGDPCLNMWRVIARTRSWLPHTRADGHTQTQATTIPGGQKCLALAAAAGGGGLWWWLVVVGCRGGCGGVGVGDGDGDGGDDDVAETLTIYRSHTGCCNNPDGISLQDLSFFSRGFVKVLSNLTDGIQLIVNILANVVHMIIETTG